MFDAVTGLASLALFREHLQLGLNRHARAGDDVAVVTVGAPDFAAAWQERTGAASVLQSRMGERIEQVVRDADVLAARRPGSFLLLVNDPSDAVAAATLVSERMIDAFATPLVLIDGLQPLTLAIGIGPSAKGDEPDHVIRRADRAYAAAAATAEPNVYRIEQSGQ
jgi:GGDEF domain-containing protein